MLFGDDLGDFLPNVRKNITPQERIELVHDYREMWGKKWFALPNPVYGSKNQAGCSGDESPGTEVCARTF